MKNPGAVGRPYRGAFGVPNHPVEVKKGGHTHDVGKAAVWSTHRGPTDHAG
jgi:hypothetical protein